MNYKVTQRKYSFPFMKSAIETAEATTIPNASKVLKIGVETIRSWIKEKDFIFYMSDENNLKKFKEEQDAIVKDRERIRKLEWYNKHGKEDYHKNKERKKTYKQEYHKKNKNRINNLEKERKSKRIFKTRANVANANARRKIGKDCYQLSGIDIWRIARKQKLKCPLTGVKLNKTNMSIDHIVPLSMGGSNRPENIRLVEKEVNKMLLNFSDESFFNKCAEILKNNGYQVIAPVE